MQTHKILLTVQQTHLNGREMYRDVKRTGRAFVCLSRPFFAVQFPTVNQTVKNSHLRKNTGEILPATQLHLLTIITFSFYWKRTFIAGGDYRPHFILTV